MPAAHGGGDSAPWRHSEPGGHARQSVSAELPSTAEKEPASHSVGATAPASQKPPALQISHAVWPLLPWKEPAAHTEHSSELALGAIVPVEHTIGAVAPIAHALPAGHVWHSPCDASPVALPKEPPAHGLAVAAPAKQ